MLCFLTEAAMKNVLCFGIFLSLGCMLYAQDWDPEADYNNTIQRIRVMSDYLDNWDASFESAEAVYGELERIYGVDTQRLGDLRYYKHVLTHIDIFRLRMLDQPHIIIQMRNADLARGISLTDGRSKVFVAIGQWSITELAFQAMLPVFERVVSEMNALLAKK
jgi:hypothetical protein